MQLLCHLILHLFQVFFFLHKSLKVTMKSAISKQPTSNKRSYKHFLNLQTVRVSHIEDWIWWPLTIGKYYWISSWSCKDQSAHPLSSKSIHSAGRGSQHLANSKIPEVQKGTLSRGTCNPFIQSYVFIFWILCVTYTALVCFVSFSVSAQTSLFILFKQSETLWFG